MPGTIFYVRALHDEDNTPQTMLHADLAVDVFSAAFELDDGVPVQRGDGLFSVVAPNGAADVVKRILTHDEGLVVVDQKGF